MLELNKIYLGDCLELMKEIPDKSMDLVLTDPPYGLNYNDGKDLAGQREKVLVAFIITQYFITTVPHTLRGQIIYIVCSLGFGFAPMTVYRLVTTWGLDYIKSKGKKKTDEEINKP